MTHMEVLTSDDENTSRGSGTCDTHGDAYVTDDDTYKLVGASPWLVVSISLNPFCPRKWDDDFH